MNVYTFHTRMFISQAVYSIYIFETVKYSFCSYSFLLTVLWTLQLFAAGVIVFGFARAFFVHSPRWFIQYIFCDICLCCNCHATAFQFKLMGKKYLSTLIAFYRCHLFRTPIYVALCYTLRIHRSRWSTAVFFSFFIVFHMLSPKQNIFIACILSVGLFVLFSIRSFDHNTIRLLIRMFHFQASEMQGLLMGHISMFSSLK